MIEEVEKWVPVRGYEGKYEVSNKGQVRSFDRMVYKEVAGKEVLRKGVLLAQTTHPELYKLVTLYGGERWKFTTSVHLIVYYSFNLHENIDPLFQVDHVDNNPSNNELSNLQRITCRQNSIKRSLSHPKTSKYTGVCWDKRDNNWKAYIRVKDPVTGKSKSKYLGRFALEEDASIAYQNKLKEILNQAA